MVGRHRDLEIIGAGYVFSDALTVVGPRVDAVSEVSSRVTPSFLSHPRGDTQPSGGPCEKPAAPDKRSSRLMTAGMARALAQGKPVGRPRLSPSLHRLRRHSNWVRD